MSGAIGDVIECEPEGGGGVGSATGGDVTPTWGEDRPHDRRTDVAATAARGAGGGATIDGDGVTGVSSAGLVGRRAAELQLAKDYPRQWWRRRTDNPHAAGALVVVGLALAASGTAEANAHIARTVVPMSPVRFLGERHRPSLRGGRAQRNQSARLRACNA